ncbi:MAG: LapA family protein [Bacteroidales bacterium]|nr:LapA family protein [Bacteroidales bacterium]
MQRSLIVSLIGILLLVILVLQNTTAIPFHIFFWDFEAPLILLLVIVALLTAVVSFFVGLGPFRKLKSELSQARQKISLLENELKVLKTPQEDKQKTE